MTQIYTPKVIHKREPDGRIIRTIKRGDREYRLHATKGWRVRKA